jgi:1-acyl-sn-glycerol-3-phosphate acyltransferase
MPRPVAFFAKAEYFTTKGVKGAVMKSFFEAVGSIPVERGEQAASVQALKTLLDILESGKGIGIYPEGTRSRDGILYRGRTGVGWLALTTGAPVIPVGTDRHREAAARGQERGPPPALHHEGGRAPLLRQDRPGPFPAGPARSHRQDHGCHRTAQRAGTLHQLQPEQGPSTSSGMESATAGRNSARGRRGNQCRSGSLDWNRGRSSKLPAPNG